MAPGWKILLSVGFSLVATLLTMLVVASLPGTDPVATEWWLVGMILPVLVSTPITVILVRQSESIRRLNAELTEAYSSLQRTAETDHLTGVANRAAFEARVTRLQARRPGWFLIVDIDHFKIINDSNGHAIGDAALVAVARAIIDTVGPDDIVARIGGEEFAIYLPVGSSAAALWLAEQIRHAVGALRIIGEDGDAIPLAVSIGVAGGPGLTVAAGMQAADRAMYHAKQNGRDRVQLAG
ncbi:GGDEF domain-containing protein [Sandarakinorhabdus sp. DWP1-3-1]|uniref:GGDEF domain-containing protein n=1 Tax=Sandarakinorhabdus sp. DWP1-3-1 TaxID=2804627 RepID=UPI003CF88D2E